MLRLPRFRVLSPRTYGEAAKLLPEVVAARTKGLGDVGVV